MSLGEYEEARAELNKFQCAFETLVSKYDLGATLEDIKRSLDSWGEELG